MPSELPLEPPATGVTPSMAVTAAIAGSPAASARFLTDPPSSISTATTVASRISRPTIDRYWRRSTLILSRPVTVQVQLTAGNGQRHTVDELKQRAVDSLDEGGQLTLVGRLDDEHTARLGRREPPVVQVVAVHRHQRASELLGKSIVFRIRSAAELVFFQHEEDVPLQVPSHVADQPRRHVGVRVDPRTRRQLFGVWSEFGREGAHSDQSRTQKSELRTGSQFKVLGSKLLTAPSPERPWLRVSVRPPTRRVCEPALFGRGAHSPSQRHIRRRSETRSSNRSRRRRSPAARLDSPCPS